MKDLPTTEEKIDYIYAVLKKQERRRIRDLIIVSVQRTILIIVILSVVYGAWYVQEHWQEMLYAFVSMISDSVADHLQGVYEREVESFQIDTIREYFDKYIE